MLTRNIMQVASSDPHMQFLAFYRMESAFIVCYGDRAKSLLGPTGTLGTFSLCNLPFMNRIRTNDNLQFCIDGFWRNPPTTISVSNLPSIYRAISL